MVNFVEYLKKEHQSFTQERHYVVITGSVIQRDILVLSSYEQRIKTHEAKIENCKEIYLCMYIIYRYQYMYTNSYIYTCVCVCVCI